MSGSPGRRTPERLAGLQELRGEILSHDGDADEIVGALETAVAATLALVAATDARRERHNAWRLTMARAQVVPGDSCLPSDAGLSWSESGGALAVDRQHIQTLTADDLLGALIHEVRRQANGHPTLGPRSLQAVEIGGNRQYADDPAGYIRRVMGATRTSARSGGPEQAS